MKIISTCLIVLLIIKFGLSTAQIPDILYYNGDTLSLYSNPLESFYTDKNPHPTSFFFDYENAEDSVFKVSYSTDCWRGYIAKWEIIESQLFLIEISDCEQDKKADLTKLFSDNFINDKVKANWFNGLLILPYGELVEYVHMGYASLYENYRILEIKNGNLTKEKLFNGEDYLEFKKRQFEQFKKTPEYKKHVEELMTDDMSQEQIDSFLFIYVIEYTKEFLID